VSNLLFAFVRILRGSCRAEALRRRMTRGGRCYQAMPRQDGEPTTATYLCEALRRSLESSEARRSRPARRLVRYNPFVQHNILENALDILIGNNTASAVGKDKNFGSFINLLGYVERVLHIAAHGNQSMVLQ